jgi:hypothetical protein
MGVITALSLWALGPMSRIEVHTFAEVSTPQYKSARDAHGAAGDAGVTLEIFAHRVRDDDTPLSLQPFLQRAGTVWISASGGGLALDNGSLSLRERSGGASAGFDLHVHPWVALTGSFGSGGFDSVRNDGARNSGWNLRGSFGLGVRWDDVRFDIAYALRGDRHNGAWLPAFYGDVTLGARIVVRQRVDVNVSVHTIDEGAIAHFALEGFATRRVGGYIGFGGGAAHPGAPIPFRTAYGLVGVAPWASRHFGANFRYQATWSTGPGYEVIEHLFYVELRSRAR